MKKRRYGELIMEAPKRLHYSGSDAYLAATGVDMVRYVAASHRSDTCDYVLEMFSIDIASRSNSLLSDVQIMFRGFAISSGKMTPLRVRISF